VTPEQLEELTAWAQRLRAEGDTEEARAAALAILMLVDELERLRRSPGGSDDDEPRAPSASRALADRLRLGPPPGDNSVREARATAPAIVPARPALDTAPRHDEPIARARRTRLAEERRRRHRFRGRLATIVLAVAALAAASFPALGLMRRRCPHQLSRRVALLPPSRPSPIET
jgi:hypothetical protein